MIKWELKEKYEKQGGRYSATIERYRQAVITAGTRLADLKSEHEAILRREFQTGKELNAEKASIRDRIAEAEREVEAAEAELQKAQEFARIEGEIDRVYVRDLVLDWNGPYLAKVRETELQPIIDRMTAAREAYYNAVLDYFLLIDTYAPDYRELRDLARNDNGNHPGNHMHVHEVANASFMPQITDSELISIEDKRSLPDGVKRAVNGGEA